MPARRHTKKNEQASPPSETAFEDGDAALIIKADLSVTLILPNASASDGGDLGEVQQLQQKVLLALAQAVQEEDIMRELLRRAAVKKAKS